MKFFSLGLALLFSISTNAASDFEKKLSQWDGSKGPLAQKLNKLYELHWDYLMTTYPEWATSTGYPGQNDRLTDMSLAAYDQRKKDALALKKVLAHVPESKLDGEDLVSLRLFKENNDLWVEGDKYPSELMPINQMDGVQLEVSELFDQSPKRNLKDYEDQIARLKGLPKKIDQVMSLMEEGLRKKVTPPKVVLGPVPSQLEAVTNPDMNQNPIFAKFKDIPAAIGEDKKLEIQNEVKKIITSQLIPSLKKFQDFFNTKYFPNCREDVAATSLPDGKNWYNYMIRRQTTTTMTADQIHELGLKEVARIRSEMEKVKEKTGFKGNLKEFDLFLKEDNQFYYTDAKDLMVGYRELSKRIDPELPKLFSVLPRLPYGVREMAEFKAKGAPTAYYMGGSIENGRPGYFEANTYNLKARPKWQMEALTLHEAVPGHHLQIALAQELQGLPQFRRQDGHTVFVEGWGLYAESLGEDLGLYKDMYSKYGQLTMEIWRAIRLVVDTGVHAKGWSREQVMQYFRDNGPFTEQQILNETDRYIAWPGQALAYKIGELKFKELREKSRVALGNKFDIRKFHDQLLGSGSLPLNVVEQKIQGWIEKEKTQVKPSKKI